MSRNFTDWKRTVVQIKNKLDTCSGMNNELEEIVELRVPIKYVGGGLVTQEATINAGKRFSFTWKGDGKFADPTSYADMLPREIYSANATIINEATDRLDKRADGLISILHMQENAFIAREIPELTMQRVKGINVQTDPEYILKNRCRELLDSMEEKLARKEIPFEFKAGIPFSWLFGKLQIEHNRKLDLAIEDYPKNYMEVIANKVTLERTIATFIDELKKAYEGTQKEKERKV